jgi:tRNA-splicing ligase RtcB
LEATPSANAVAEEMTEAYKNVSDVVAATEAAGLATRVARLQPSLVLKG